MLYVFIVDSDIDCLTIPIYLVRKLHNCCYKGKDYVAFVSIHPNVKVWIKLLSI